MRPTHARLAFAAAFFAIEGALVARGLATPDRLFAFQMFNESSTIAIHLTRRVRAGDGWRDVPVAPGERVFVDKAGRPMRWRDLVRDATLSTLGRPVPAAYGADAQLYRLGAALRHVTEQAGGGELLALFADVDVARNGRPPERVHLDGGPRR